MSGTSFAVDERIGMSPGANTERVWQQMHERLLSYIQRRVGTVHNAEDILQDVFVRIHANLARLRQSQSVTAWVYQIARNAIIDYHRKRAAATRAVATLAERIDDGEADDIVLQAQDEFAACLDPLLDELPDHYRQAVRMTELDGVTQKEAAARLGLSVSGMKARVQRGRGKLKDVIEDCCCVELDRRGGLVDYDRRDGAACDECPCDGSGLDVPSAGP